MSVQIAYKTGTPVTYIDPNNPECTWTTDFQSVNPDFPLPVAVIANSEFIRADAIDTQDIDISSTGADFSTSVTLPTTIYVVLQTPITNTAQVSISGVPGQLFADSFKMAPASILAMDLDLSAIPLYFRSDAVGQNIYVWAIGKS